MPSPKSRDLTRTVRVDLKDYLYLHKLAGEDRAIKEAVRELVETHKEINDIEIEEYEPVFEGQDNE